jgi:hypothetical protein
MIRAALAFTITVLAAACGGNHDYLPTEELMKPEACMDCHPKHFAEWQSSMHAYAADDPVFIAMNAKGQAETGGTLGDFCVNCHAPMARRLNLTTDGLNLATVPQWAKGVTCFFCHSVDSVTGDHNNPLVLASDDKMRGGLRDPGPVDSPAHRSMYSPLVDADAPESAAMCGACHDLVNNHGVQLERTFSEWEETIFGKVDRPLTFLTCAECHMTPYTDVVADTPEVDVPQREYGRRDHGFPGIDVALTPWPGTTEQLAGIDKLLKGSINPKLCVEPLATDSPVISYWLDNVGNGHKWPSGAAQDRRAWAEIIAYDTNDNVLFSSGVVPDGVDPDPTEPFILRMWDDIFDEAGQPTHDFWEVRSHDDTTLLKAATTTCPTTEGFFHARIHDIPVFLNSNQVARVTARTRIRPLSYEMMDELGIDPSIQALLPTHEVGGTQLEWTPDTEGDDGCVGPPMLPPITPVCP